MAADLGIADKVTIPKGITMVAGLVQQNIKVVKVVDLVAYINFDYTTTVVEVDHNSEATARNYIAYHTYFVAAFMVTLSYFRQDYTFRILFSYFHLD